MDGCNFKTSYKTKDRTDCMIFALFNQIFTHLQILMLFDDQGNIHVHVKWITVLVLVFYTGNLEILTSELYILTDLILQWNLNQKFKVITVYCFFCGDWVLKKIAFIFCLLLFKDSELTGYTWEVMTLWYM